MTSRIASPRLHRLIAGAAGVGPAGVGTAGSGPVGPAVTGPARQSGALTPDVLEPDASGPAVPGPETTAAQAAGDAEEQRCRLCAAAIPDEHRHLLDLTARELRCACRACAVLFDQPAGLGDRYRLVPDRRWHLPDFVLDDPAWAGLRIPVDMAFFFHDTRAGRVACFYPSPAGAVESRLDLSDWRRIVRDNPVLDTLRPDTEALLVDRSRGAHDHWLVPIDDCYALVGLIRTHWTGLAGGPRVWTELAAHLGALRDRARTASARPPVPAGTAKGAAQ
jgi:hypothetical protein